MRLQQTVADVAALVRGRATGPGDAVLASLRSLGAAGPDDLAAVFRDAYLSAARESRARCLIVGEAMAEDAGLETGPDGPRALVRVPDPELAVDTLVATWGPREEGPAPGVHPSAVVEEGAEVDPSAALGPWAYVGRGARVGPGTRLWARAYVGAHAVVGAGCKLYPGSYLGERCTVGDRVVLHAGAVLGADGFGFRRGEGGEHVKSPQVGIVTVGDDVEVGANSTIDRARLEATVVGDGVKIDDQVHVAHNCVIGEHTAIAGQGSLAGGARLGKRVLMAGRAGVKGGVVVGDDAVLGAATVALRDVPAGSYVLGYPAVAHARWKRQVLSLERLPDLISDMKAAREGGSARAP